MIRKLVLTLLAGWLVQFAYAQTSPWGTGSINNQSLDTLNGPAIYTSHTTDVFNLNSYLSGYTYNMYIPASYDGTEPYGLITFINSGNSGTIFNQWIPVLDEKKLIMISANNIGNSIAVVTRMGVAMAGSEKLQEVLNIDTNRVFTSGNSGGARSCAALLFFFPEYFQGMVPNCGSSYLRLVDQDYETFQPNSHYEYGLFLFTPTNLDYVRSFDRKYAMMTSFDDFREGDIMNIYHNGMEPDGFKSKILETSGAHCSTTTAHFRDAMNFVEHPHIDIIRDSFDLAPVVGDGFKLEAAQLNNQQLVFDHNSANVARAYSNNAILWNDDKGAILRTSIELDSLSYNENTFFNIGLVDYSDTSIYSQSIGHQLYPSKPNLLLSIAFDDAQPTLFVLAENPAGGISNDTLFTSTFSDWSSNEPLDIKYYIWNQEVRIELGKHLLPVPSNLPLVKLLDDRRSIRIRTDANYWDPTDFEQGTLLTLVSGKLNNQASSSALKVNFVEVIAAEKLECTGPPSTGIDPITACNSYTWIDGITYFDSDSTATFTVTTAEGCDSIVTLNLTVNTVNTTVTQTGADLTSDQPGATYQWIDCATNTPIPGATNQTYTAIANGDYAVIVSFNGCTDTSSCHKVVGVGILENAFANQVSLYPNPTDGPFAIDLGQSHASVQVSIRDLYGRLVHNQAYRKAQRLELQLDEPAGVYFLTLESEGKVAVVRLIKR